MKKIIFKFLIAILLVFVVFLTPNLVNAQSITPSTIRVKSSDNSQVLADQSLDFFTNSPYYSTQVELPFSSPNLQYNSTYGIDIYMDFYVEHFNDWGNFGFNSPGIYISSNGLHAQSFTYNVFSNTFQNVSNVVAYYRMHLSGTFATNSAGTLYIAFPFNHAIDLYGAKVISVDLNYYGSNTTNSDIIASNNQNTQNIITNNNNNTQNIINNNNQNTQQIIESNKACTKYDKSNTISNGYLTMDGQLINSSEFGISDFINISGSTIDIIQPSCTTQGSCLSSFACFYDSSKQLISCVSTDTTGSVSIPTGSIYFRFGSRKSSNVPIISICGNGNQILNNSINDMNNTLNNSDTIEAESDLSSFFNNFSANNHGLASLISSPLRLLQTLNSSSCSSLSFPLPFVNKNATLPCFKPIVQTHFSTFLTLYQLITNGLVAYWVCINLFSKVKGFQDPQSDKIEVLEL